MRAALLCPGPSLSDTYPGPTGFDLVVAVNRAGMWHRIDAWAVMDWPLMLKTEPPILMPVWQRVLLAQDGGRGDGRPVLVTHRDSLEMINRKKVDWPGEVFDSNVLGAAAAGGTGSDGACPAAGAMLYTAPRAMLYAAHRGAKAIDVYGADWSGKADADGVEAGANRSPRRWTNEAAIWQRVTDWLKPRGVSVERHT
jgi:hypothetical protein